MYRILDLRVLFSPQFWRIQIYRCKISKPVKRFEKIQSVIFLDKKLEYCENRWSRDARVGNFSNIAAQISSQVSRTTRKRKLREKRNILSKVIRNFVNNCSRLDAILQLSIINLRASALNPRNYTGIVTCIGR